MHWRSTAFALALSLFAVGVPAQQQDQMKDQMRQQQEALKRAKEQGGQQSSSSPAACTGGWWKTTNLQVNEMVPSAGGSGIDAACRAHDQCYKNCKGPEKSSCDSDLKRDTAKVCNSLATPAEKKKCSDQQGAMSTMVEKFGAGAFKQARDKCPARR